MKLKLMSLIENDNSTNNLLDNLRLFAKNQISVSELMEREEYIYDIKVRNPRGQSLLIFEFKKDELIDIVGLDSEDVWFYNAIRTYGYEVSDFYTVRNDFDEGYGPVWYKLNEENKTKLEKIADYYFPGVPFDLTNDTYQKKLNERLTEDFDREVDSILSEFHYLYESMLKDEILRVTEIEVSTPLKEKGFIFDGDWNKISTTVANLVLYIRMNQFTDNLKSLIHKMLDDLLWRVGGWHENFYDYEDWDDFDSQTYNNYVSTNLDNMIEKLEDNPDFASIKEMRKRILKKFKIRTWIPLPKNKKFSFNILGFNDLLIVVSIEKPDGSKFKKELTEENFYNLLYQPELFDLDT